MLYFGNSDFRIYMYIGSKTQRKIEGKSECEKLEAESEVKNNVETN